jgi:hypothetical protein
MLWSPNADPRCECFNDGGGAGFVVRSTPGHDLLEGGVVEAERNVGGI